MVLEFILTFGVANNNSINYKHNSLYLETMKSTQYIPMVGNKHTLSVSVMKK